MQFIIAFILGGWLLLDYSHFVKRRDEISFSHTPRKRYEYELWIKLIGQEYNPLVIRLYSDSPKHHLASIKYHFYHRSKKAYVFKTSDTHISIPSSDIWSIELRSKQRKSHR